MTLMGGGQVVSGSLSMERPSTETQHADLGVRAEQRLSPSHRDRGVKKVGIIHRPSIFFFFFCFFVFFFLFFFFFFFCKGGGRIGGLGNGTY